MFVNVTSGLYIMYNIVIVFHITSAYMYFQVKAVFKSDISTTLLIAY